MTEYKLSRYRWVILAAIIPIIICTETYWLTFSPIATMAQGFYHTSSLGITMFATSYLIMYIVLAFPASYIIDRFGFRPSLIIGAVLTAVFGVLRAVFVDNFTISLVCQFCIAAGQPFLLNISTKVPANWFPVSERSLAAGLLTMAQYLGFVVPMVISPMLAQSSGIPTVLLVYAVMAVVCAAIAILFTRERPATPPGPAGEAEASPLAMFRLFRNRNYLYVLLISFLSMGIFNTLLTVIESILRPNGINMDQAGIVGSVFVLCGVLGAVLLPLLSDKLRRRIPIFLIALTILVPLYAVIGYSGSFFAVALAAGVAGFLVLGVGPILFQHGAEVAYPVQEGASIGLILLMGQISGALFIFIFEKIGSVVGNVSLPMLLLVLAAAVQVPFVFLMRESALFKREKGNEQ